VAGGRDGDARLPPLPPPRPAASTRDPPRAPFARDCGARGRLAAELPQCSRRRGAPAQVHRCSPARPRAHWPAHKAARKAAAAAAAAAGGAR
jgi:hypothetical protein